MHGDVCDTLTGMHIVDLLYLIFITLALCAAYFILLKFLPRFFAQEITRSRRNFLFPLLFILIFSAVAYAVSYALPDPEIGNRVLHISGGFAGFLTCFFATRDSGVRINKFQFFVCSALIVLALGVANELLEFFLQEYVGIISAATVTDTWLDLASNTIGIILASMCSVPFHK